MRNFFKKSKDMDASTSFDFHRLTLSHETLQSLACYTLLTCESLYTAVFDSTSWKSVLQSVLASSGVYPD